MKTLCDSMNFLEGDSCMLWISLLILLWCVPFSTESRRSSVDIFLKAAGYLDCAVRHVLPQLPSELRYLYICFGLSIRNAFKNYLFNLYLLYILKENSSRGPCWRSTTGTLPPSTWAGISFFCTYLICCLVANAYIYLPYSTLISISVIEDSSNAVSHN